VTPVVDPSDLPGHPPPDFCTGPGADDIRLRIRLDEHTSPARLLVSGEIDLANQQEFHGAVTDAVSRVPRLILDLRDVTHLNSARIGTLFRHHEKLIAVVVEPNSVIARALHYSGFIRLVPVLHDA
jgi:anti-anti-sigma factor